MDRHFHDALEAVLDSAIAYLQGNIPVEELQASVDEAIDLSEPCEYCSRRPAFRVTWQWPDGSHTHMRLCAECDEREIEELNSDG